MNNIGKRLAADKTAAKIDQAFFKSHRDQISYRRKVVPAEVPRTLRKLDVRSVQVYRIEDGIIFRLFIDANGRAVGHSTSIDPEKYPAAARHRIAQICQIVFDAIYSNRGER
jgi:hypothetical protein